MSCRVGIALSAAALFMVATSAHAETSAALLGGYGNELGPTGSGTGYGLGLGTRIDTRLRNGLVIGGSFTNHFGSSERLEDPLRTSTYRATYHALYVGPEIGWELRDPTVVLRPYVGGGAWFAFQRTVVRNLEVRDDRVSPFIAPGVLVGYRTPYGYAGVDFRVPCANARTALVVAPAAFIVVSMTAWR